MSLEQHLRDCCLSVYGPACMYNQLRKEVNSCLSLIVLTYRSLYVNSTPLELNDLMCIVQWVLSLICNTEWIPKGLTKIVDLKA